VFAPEPLRISEIAQDGDPPRRASLNLILRGLDADEGQAWTRAEGLYERAIQVDSTNPFAFLAMARHRVERAQARAALDSLERAESLLASEGWPPERLEAHLAGLRGRALFLAGRLGESAPLLARARELAPVEWADGRLSPAELR
jgi:tetratricopeptide (TPR) repeat protein